MPSAASGDNRIVCPFIASMDNNAAITFDVNALARETVSISAIEREFDVTLSDSDAASFLNCFKVDGSGNNLNVTLDNATALKAAMEAAFNAAVDGDSKNVEGWLQNNLSETLTTHILYTLGVSVDVSSASVTVDKTAASASLENGLTRAVCDTMYLQIPQTTLDLYKDDNDQQTTRALPLQKGDILTFVYDVNAPSTLSATIVSRVYDPDNKAVTDKDTIVGTVNTTPDSEDKTGSGNNGVTFDMTPSHPEYKYNSASVAFSGSKHRVAFNLKMGSGSGVFSW